tara:strand:+ start:351 stop:953 length:603 start_codon:yes stop_codon:yes gene_type:complete
MGIFNKKFAKMINIVLFGKPGAGKGTQASFLKSQYDFVHISTGDLFRFNIKNKTELGILAKSYLDRGDLVPDRITIDMLENEVNKDLDAKGFIFDGFPRTESQAEALDNFLEGKLMKITATLSLEAEDGILINRLIERGKSSGRVDDQDESKIKNRFEEYNQKTAPLINYYKRQNKFHSINGIGSIKEITERLIQLIDQL